MMRFRMLTLFVGVAAVALALKPLVYVAAIYQSAEPRAAWNIIIFFSCGVVLFPFATTAYLEVVPSSHWKQAAFTAVGLILSLICGVVATAFAYRLTN